MAETFAVISLVAGGWPAVVMGAVALGAGLAAKAPSKLGARLFPA